MSSKKITAFPAFFSCFLFSFLIFFATASAEDYACNICDKGCVLDDGCGENTPYLCKKSWSTDRCVVQGYDGGCCGGKTDEGGYCFECSGGCVLQSELGEKCGLFTACSEDEYCCKRAEWYKSNTCKPKHSDMGCCGGPPTEQDRITFLKAVITNNYRTDSGKIKWEVKEKGTDQYVDFTSDCVEGSPEIKLEEGQSITVTCTSGELPTAVTGPHEGKITWLIYGDDLGTETRFTYGDSTPPVASVKLCREYFSWEDYGRKCGEESSEDDDGRVYAYITVDEDIFGLDSYVIKLCEIDWGAGDSWEPVKILFTDELEHLYKHTGAYIVRFRCENKYGLVSDIASDTITVTQVDTTPPVVSLVVGDFINAEFGIDGVSEDDDSYVWAVFSESDPESDITSCEISWDGGDLWWNPKTRDYDCWYYSEGTYTVKYRCENELGLISVASADVTVVLPDSKPGLSLVLGDEKTMESDESTDGFVWAETVSFDDVHISSCEISWDGGTTWEWADSRVRHVPHIYRTTGLKTVKYRCTNINGVESDEASATINVSSLHSSAGPRLKILFVPIKWSGTSEEFESFVDLAVGKFTEDLELKNCPDRVEIVKLDTETESYGQSMMLCSVGSCNKLSSLKDFAKEKGYNPSDYDVVVGVIRDEDNTEGRLLGVGGAASSSAFWVSTKYEISFAHELGHIFGLADQYCSNPAGSTDGRCNDGGYPEYFYEGRPDKNPLSGDLGCDPLGEPCCNFTRSGHKYSCKDEAYGACCYGNKNALGGRSIMSYADAEGPRAFDANEIEHLSKIPQLQC